MDAERVKQVLVDGIDRVVSRPIFGVSVEQRAVLLACRQVVISDSAVCDRIAKQVGPYHGEGETMAKKAARAMTAQEFGAIDWASLIAKLPALARLIPLIIEILTSDNDRLPMGNALAANCPAECKEACHNALQKLAEHNVAMLHLHECCCGDE